MFRGYTASMSHLSPLDVAATYAIGDVHGEVTLLQRLFADLPLRDEDTIVFLGDYLDRGEDSASLLAFLRELSRTHRACVFLRGNHEDAWLAQWDGVRFRKAPEIDGARKAWADFGGAMPFEVGHWLEGTLIEYEDEYAYYVHAGVVPGKPVWRTPGLLKLWGAQGFLESTYDWGKPVVFGHWQMPTPLVQQNKIGIDTGACESGVLTAVRLPDRAIIQVRR